MGAHTREPTLARRMLDPIFLGACFAGVTFIGAMAVSQEAPPVVPETPNAVAVAIADDAAPSLDVPTGVAPASMPASVPVALQIDAIGVRSRLHGVGLDDDGTIETPEGALYDEAAWYKHSPTPGSIGPSIILGHVDSAAAGPSVFYRLGDLTRGDKVLITRGDGTVARFSVDSVRRYAKDAFPTKLVYGDLNHAGLRLVTCGGEFDEVAGHYVDNVVVFASLSP